MLTNLSSSGRWFGELSTGERFAQSLTVTETHLAIGAGLIGDFNPLHVDEAFARASRFGGRILHGMLTSAIMGAPVGMYFAGTAIAYLEHNVSFKSPVRPGDTLTTTWTIERLVPKPKHGGGIVEMTAVACNQDDIVVATGNGKILVFTRPTLSP